MLTDAIKQQILSLAIRGKLTDQRPEDGSAEDLYRAILAEKKRLIKAGKLKKEKPLPPIEEKDIPFDIPENWKWVRLGEVFTVITGKTPSKIDPENFFGAIPFYKPANITDCEYTGKVSEFVSEKGALCTTILPKDTLLFNSIGNIGKCALIQTPGICNQQINAVLPHSFILPKFALYLFRSSFVTNEALGRSSMTTISILNKSNFCHIPLPLPPLPEQERIASKLEAIMTALQDLEGAKTRAQAIKTELRKSLLQEAIQGKLTDQRPEDGSAEDLYRAILAEKKRLIKAGKLKKENPLPPIEEKDIPFDIPENWKWVRLGEVFVHNTGKAQNATAPSIGGTMRKFITTSNLYWNSFDFSKVKEMLFTESEIERCSARKGDLLVCEGGDFGRAAIWPYDEEICIQNHIHRIRPILKLAVKLYYHIFFLYKQTNLLQGRGVAIQGLSSGALHNLVIPLPPLAEQERIVAKLEELLPLCD
ncbi:MAG: restriction endonuclease subunit S [Akkermansia muciniphila]|nr:restriction endonuclease subunit S [Akkermansia muciniphila]